MIEVGGGLSRSWVRSTDTTPWTRKTDLTLLRTYRFLINILSIKEGVSKNSKKKLTVGRYRRLLFTSSPKTEVNPPSSFSPSLRDLLVLPPSSSSVDEGPLTLPHSGDQVPSPEGLVPQLVRRGRTSKRPPRLMVVASPVSFLSFRRVLPPRTTSSNSRCPSRTSKWTI